MPYDAFISYNHSADATLAAALQSALHSFAKPWYKLRAVHIFRDQTNLAVNPALWSSIRDALDQSLFLIFFASPEAAASPWVAKEAEYWISRNGTSHVLIVLTGGTLKWDHLASCFTLEHTNSLPQSLLHAFPEEPLFLDLRWAREPGASLRMREPRFHESVLQLAATLHNRAKDELDGADIRTRRQNRLLATSGVIIILLIALFAYRQYRLTYKESVFNSAAALAASSAKLLADSPDRAREAALLAVESNRLNPSFEGNQALRAAVSLLPAGAQVYPPQNANPAERIRDIAFSPDGAILAVARDDGSTQLFNLKDRKPIGFFEPDEQPAAFIKISGNPGDASLDNNSAVSVAFNSSGSLLATATRDGVARVWTVPESREVLRVAHGSPVSQVAFRSKPEQLVTASDDGHVRIFDIARAESVADFKSPGKVVSAFFSPNGSVLAALSSECVVSLFDPLRKKLLRTMGGSEAGFNMAFNADGTRLAASCGDFAFVWDVSSGQQLLKATHAASSETLTPMQWIYSAAITPDGKLLAYAARGDSSARVWNVETRRQILELKHDSAVAAVSFNADGTRLGTGSYDGTARVWEIPSGRELERAALAGGSEVVSFSPAGDRFAAGGVEGSVLVSETRRADRPAFLDLPAEVRSVAFSPDGQRFAVGTVSQHHSPLVKISDVAGNTLRDIEFHGAPTIDKLFFPDQNLVIAQWSDKLFLISIDNSSVAPVTGISGDLRVDPSGKILAVQRDSVSRLYSLPDVRQISSLDGPPSGLVRTAAQGQLLAFDASAPPNQFFVDIWSTSTKMRVTRITLPGELTRASLNASGTILFTAQNENVQAWDIPSGKRRLSFVASGDVEQFVADPTSAAFATLIHGRLTVWDSVTGTRLAELPDMGYLRAAAFSPDGRYLLAGYDERSAALWIWRSADLRDQACARLSTNLSRDEWKRWFPKQSYRPICPGLPSAN